MRLCGFSVPILDACSIMLDSTPKAMAFSNMSMQKDCGGGIRLSWRWPWLAVIRTEVPIDQGEYKESQAPSSELNNHPLLLSILTFCTIMFSLLLFLFLGLVPHVFSMRGVVELNWDVTWVTASPDGFARPVVGINGQFPCPTINV
jgi:hypothetical protein